MNKIRKRPIQTLNPSRRKAKTAKASRLTISHGDWQKQGHAQLCRNRKECDCTVLVLQSNFAENILNSICKIEFPCLQRLYLAQNLIQSIQEISRIYFPALQYLDLSNNKIISFKPLGRSCWPNLNVLHISNNPAHDSIISIDKASLPQLQVFSCDYYNYHRPIFQDSSSIIKFQSLKIQQLFFDSCKRIIQKKVVQALKRRFPKAQIASQLMSEDENQFESQHFQRQISVKLNDLSNFEYLKRLLMSQK